MQSYFITSIMNLEDIKQAYLLTPHRSDGNVKEYLSHVIGKNADSIAEQYKGVYDFSCNLIRLNSLDRPVFY